MNWNVTGRLIMRKRKHIVDVSAHLGTIPFKDRFDFIGFSIDSENTALFDSWYGVNGSWNEIIARRQGHKIISSPLRLFDRINSTE
jgi:hypothetical protein